MIVRAVLWLACALSTSGCGMASVRYAASAASPTTAEQAGAHAALVQNILGSAAKGSQTLTLPVSRLVVVATPAEAAWANPAAPQEGTAAVPGITTILTAPSGTTYAVNVLQVESAVSFRVQPTNDFFSQNDFGVTRLANTRIPTGVTNTFTDQTASRIKTIASTVAAIIQPVAASSSPDASPPPEPRAACLKATEDLVVDDEAFKAGAVPGGWSARKTVWNQASGNCLDVSLMAHAPAADLVPLASLISAFAQSAGDWSKVWPVPACMTVDIVIKPRGASVASAEMARGQITLIDPDYVELMPIPQKGRIAMHPICGADLSNSATDPYQADFDSITAILAAFPAR